MNTRMLQTATLIAVASGACGGVHDAPGGEASAIDVTSRGAPS